MQGTHILAAPRCPVGGQQPCLQVEAGHQGWTPDKWWTTFDHSKKPLLGNRVIKARSNEDMRKLACHGRTEWATNYRLGSDE
jgi:hypothetical protein